MVTREQIVKVIEGNGFKKDRYGHWQKTTENSDGVKRNYRYKLSDRSVRKEVQVVYDDGRKEWFRIGSGYYKNITIDERLNRVIGMKG